MASRGYYNIPPNCIEQGCITISANGGGGAAFWHPYPFAAVPDVLVCELQKGWKITPAFWIYLCNAISHNAWRFDYYRKSTRSRVLSDIKIMLPMKGSDVDYKFIEREMKRVPKFSQLLKMLDDGAKNRST